MNHEPKGEWQKIKGFRTLNAVSFTTWRVLFSLVLLYNSESCCWKTGVFNHAVWAIFSHQNLSPVVNRSLVTISLIHLPSHLGLGWCRSVPQSSPPLCSRLSPNLTKRIGGKNKWIWSDKIKDLLSKMYSEFLSHNTPSISKQEKTSLDRTNWGQNTGFVWLLSGTTCNTI